MFRILSARTLYANPGTDLNILARIWKLVLPRLRRVLETSAQLPYKTRANDWCVLPNSHQLASVFSLQPFEETGEAAQDWFRSLCTCGTSLYNGSRHVSDIHQ
ncbi:hypothetical protein VTH82DRAFT_2230 [Thermothelomyces myriococcoides]